MLIKFLLFLLAMTGRADCPNTAWSQCDGLQFSGQKCCAAGLDCVFVNSYYSQCQTSLVPTPAPSPAPVPTPATNPPASVCSALYGQCGGTGYTGPTCCAAGSTCVYSNPYYSQCLPSTPSPAPAPANYWKCVPCEELI